jgi:hypothetical protein
MTTTDIVLRINDAIRSADPSDLYDLSAAVSDLLIEQTAIDAWLALIETACESIAGEFR